MFKFVKLEDCLPPCASFGYFYSMSPTSRQKPREPKRVRIPGKRALNKAEKLRRIKEAARHLFLSQGFDDTTTRAIADRADVALGTLFTYASNKRDLLFLVGNDMLEEMSRAATGNIRPHLSVMRNLLDAFRPLYTFFKTQPKLSRLILRELVFYDSGKQAERAIATRMEMISVVTAIIENAIEKGEIVSKADPKQIGWIIFSIYQAEIRFWLREDKLSVDDGLDQLRRALLLCFSGMKLTRPKRNWRS